MPMSGVCLCRGMLLGSVGSVAAAGQVMGQEQLLASAGCGQVEHLQAVEI